ncbi:MAG: response regulator [Candidatus Margulisbacteria bacterium]|nr:response regulator [Candidatus Margulisiibacteriota bacterium]
MNKKVLIVNDLSFMHDTIKMIFESYPNITFSSALDGMDGIHSIEKEHFDLIISDIDMPHCNGVEFISSIQKEGNQIPIIVLSASIDKGTRHILSLLNVKHIVDMQFYSFYELRDCVLQTLDLKQ